MQTKLRRVRYPFVLVVFILLFQGFVVSSVGEERSTDLAEEQHPLYIVKEVVETTSDWTEVKWVQDPVVIATRHRILEGSNAPEFRYEVRDLTVWVAKRSFDTTKVVIEVEALALRGDLTTIVNITKGDIEYTRAEFFAYNKTSEDFGKLAEFLHDGVGPRAFELDLPTLYDMPSATANVERAVKELDKNVLAFYYPWYASPEGPSSRLFHWNEGFADYPLLDLYDSADEGVILAHMAMAKHAGIDGFIASWWGIGSFEDNQVARILNVAEQVGLQISIYYESVRDFTQQDIVEDFTYVVNSYADSPSFLKDSGRPVLFVYAVPYADRDPSFWLEVRRRVEANVGPVVLIGDTVDQEYLHAFDGFHTYIHLGEDVEEFYGDAIERLKIALSSVDVDEAFSLAYSGGEVSVDLKSFSLTVIPGYDDTKVRSPGYKLDRQGGEVYTRLWRTAIELDAHSVLITSWNEWHEGTEIEPSREYGFDYINMTRRFIEEYKQTSIYMPEANFLATVESLTQHPDLTGDGSIVLAAAETPALYVNVSVSGEEGLSSLDLQGDFYTYLKDRNRNRVSIVIPSVPSQSELVVRAVYEAESIRPFFNISVTAYDVLGRLFELYKGQLRPVVLSSITASVSSGSIEIGESITVSGSLSPKGEGRPIILLYTKPDSSTLTRNVTMAADGSYSDTFNPDTVGTWRVKASWEGDVEFEEAASQVHFFIVRKASSVSILSPENKTYFVSDVPLTFTVSELTSWIGYSQDGQANVTITGNTALSGLSDGSHSLIVYTKDIAGNTGSSEMVYFTIETQEPKPPPFLEPFPIWIVAVIVIIAALGTPVYLLKIRKKS